MIQPKPPTNGAGGLKWSTIIPSASIMVMILLAGIGHWKQVAVMDEKIDTHIVADQKRDDRVETRVHAMELSVAAMQGGE